MKAVKAYTKFRIHHYQSRDEFPRRYLICCPNQSPRYAPACFTTNNEKQNHKVEGESVVIKFKYFSSFGVKVFALFLIKEIN